MEVHIEGNVHTSFAVRLDIFMRKQATTEDDERSTR